jgi:hypothetical protein
LSNSSRYIINDAKKITSNSQNKQLLEELNDETKTNIKNIPNSTDDNNDE